MVAVVLTNLCLYCLYVGTWENPIPPVTFDVTTNATNPMRVGDVVEYNCTAHDLFRPESTIVWKQARGSVERRMIAGHNGLVWRKTIQSSDHGTEVFCAASFFRKRPDRPGQLNTFYAFSDKIPIQVEGGSQAIEKKSKEKLTLSVRPAASSYKAGDYVEYTCTAENMRYPVIDIRQRQGHIERQVYVGYQAGGYRWKGHNLTESDNGSVIYCQAWQLDSRYNSYAFNGEPFTLNVH
ncbi:uncharacterized protein LOC126378504 [Pectinophora gossypiella]|uniref:uncharacterized protein LOC126378504 n=1 Tax=Pectinophora gossypiella TaxID=13191 RepID=UPI00214ECC80|nr:uncharacterized protein LOC126378504 [Pectinophora gossypiella]